MSIIFMDSFDHYTTAAQAAAKGWTLGGPSHLDTVIKRTGVQSGRLQYAACATLPVAVANGTAIYLHFAMYANATWPAPYICGVSGNPADQNQYQVAILTSSVGEVYARTHSGTIAGTVTAPGKFRQNTWNYFQVKFVVSDTVGEVEVYLNGELIIDVDTKDTKFDASTTVTAVILNGGYEIRVDDFVVNYNDGDGINDGFLGEPRVVCLLPQTDAVAAGSNADFTPSTGTDHGALVDEATPNDDTDYVSSSTLNHVDSWEYPALGYTGDIKGVQMSLRAKKSDSGTRAIAAVTKPAATNRVHATNHYLGMTDYVYWKAIWDQNPEDSAAWEVADVDGAEFGVKVTV